MVETRSRRRSRSNADEDSQEKVEASTTITKNDTGEGTFEGSAEGKDKISIDHDPSPAADGESESGNPDQEVNDSLKLPGKISSEREDDREKSSRNLNERRNELTSLIPGYRAPMRLESSRSTGGGLEALRKNALRNDPSTSKYTFGSKAGQRLVATAAQRSTSGRSNNFKHGNPPVKKTDAGDGWFGMKPSVMTEDLKRDMQLIRNRNYLDPKRFYKSSDARSKFVQVGTVIEGTTEFYSSRLTKKQRRTNLTEEIMADDSAADYARNKYKRMQQEQAQKYLKRTKKRR